MLGTSSPLLGYTREVSAQGAGGGWGQGLGFSLFLDMLGGLSLYPPMVCYQKDGFPQLRNL